MKFGDCDIIQIGKRRDGGMRYWCLAHRGDATAKYGVRARECRYANTRFGHSSPTKSIAMDDYPGGVAIWGAVPPVYDTSGKPLDAGVHLHARKSQGDKKEIDATFPNVEIQRERVRWRVEELDAINQMVSSILGIQTSEISCTYCGKLHLDKDWFSVHPHSRHLCSWCGQHFKDDKRGVGNPIAALSKVFPALPPVKSKKRIKIAQRDFAGGISIWGSNPALAWTSPKREESGIHLHAYSFDGKRLRDDTFGELIVDGIRLDPHWIRVLMAQRSLPHLANRIVSLVCPRCSSLQRDKGTDAFTPRRERLCGTCRHPFSVRGRLKNVIANPAIADLMKLSKFAVREPTNHDLGLLTESP